MSHIEPDDLATLALDGGRPDAAARAHLDECAACRAEYDALVRTVELGRGGGVDDLEPPPSSVWTAVHGELGLAPELAADPFSSRPSEAAPASAAEPGRPQAREATVTPLPDPSARRAGAGGLGEERVGSRRRWWPIAVAAAAIGVVAGIALGVVLAGLGDLWHRPRRGGRRRGPVDRRQPRCRCSVRRGPRGLAHPLGCIRARQPGAARRLDRPLRRARGYRPRRVHARGRVGRARRRGSGALG